METILSDIDKLISRVDEFEKTYSTDDIWTWKNEIISKINVWKPEFKNEIVFDKRLEMVFDFKKLKPIIKSINLILINAFDIVHSAYKFTHECFSKHFSEPRCFEVTELLERMISNIEDKLSPVAFTHGNAKYVRDDNFYSTFTFVSPSRFYYTNNPKFVNKLIEFYNEDGILCDRPYIALDENMEVIFSNLKMVNDYKELFRSLGEILKKNKGFGVPDSAY